MNKGSGVAVASTEIWNVSNGVGMTSAETGVGLKVSVTDGVVDPSADGKADCEGTRTKDERGVSEGDSKTGAKSPLGVLTATAVMETETIAGEGLAEFRDVTSEGNGVSINNSGEADGGRNETCGIRLAAELAEGREVIVKATGVGVLVGTTA